MTRIRFREVLSLNAYWFGLSFLWNSLHVLILPAVLLHLVSDDLKNTYLGLLTMAGLFIAMIIQPISGALSDRWASRWGRRRPLIFLGTAFDFLFLAILGWAGGLGWLAVGYIGLQVSSNIAHGPAQGLLPDRVPKEQIGMASGVKNILDMLGLVVSSLIVGEFLTEDARRPIGVLAMVGVALAAATAVTLVGTRELPSIPADRNEKKRLRPSFQIPEIEYFRLSRLREMLHAHPAFWRLILSRLVFLVGVYGIQAFAQYYLRDVLAVENPIQLTGRLLASITVTLLVFAMAAGPVGDRIGHTRVSLAAAVLGATGALLLMFARTPQAVLSFGSILGAGVGLFLTSNWAIANHLAPQREAGRYLGLTNLATAGAGVLSRLEGPLIDGLNAVAPGQWWGYNTLFLVSIVGMILSGWLLLRWGTGEEPIEPKIAGS